MTKKKETKPNKPKEAKRKFNAMEHWKGMPEFVQKNAGAIKHITVNFATNEDMLKFSKLVGQQITAKTISIWYPAVEIDGALDKRYSDKKKKK